MLRREVFPLFALPFVFKIPQNDILEFTIETTFNTEQVFGNYPAPFIEPEVTTKLLVKYIDRIDIYNVGKKIWLLTKDPAKPYIPDPKNEPVIKIDGSTITVEYQASICYLYDCKLVRGNQ